MSNQDPNERRIEDAYDNLANDAAYVQTPETPGHKGPSSWMIPAMAIACVALVVGVVAVVAANDDSPEDESSIVANPSSTEAMPPSTSSVTTSPEPGVTSTNLAPPSDERLVPSFDEDLYYPWVYPPPYLSSYEEGCLSPEEVLEGFLGNIIGDYAPSYTVLGSDGPWIDYLVYEKGATGVVLNTGTIVTLAPIDPTVRDCELTYGVHHAKAMDDVTIDSPASDSLVGSTFSVDGLGRGFEAQVDLTVLDDSYQPVGQGFAHGGWALAPYATELTLATAPIDSNLIVVARSSGAASGAIEPFAVTKVRFDGSVVDEDISVRGISIMVVGVAADDTLNVRSGPGVHNEVVAELAPFETGLLAGDQIITIGEDEWIEVWSRSDPDLRGWVNKRFTAPAG